MPKSKKLFKSHGTGDFSRSQFKKIGRNVVFGKGVLVFHPENIEIGDNVYVGHYTILKGYHKNKMIIGGGTWIGQQCFFHSAGGIKIGQNVGIGPGVKILTSSHGLDEPDKPILHSTVKSAPVKIEDGCDIGVNACILPGVRIGAGAQIGAGAVVSSNIKKFSIAAGVPAKVIRVRK
jgi:acetyltransferase-like isoleucine patch superfamily enzyme